METRVNIDRPVSLCLGGGHRRQLVECKLVERGHVEGRGLVLRLVVALAALVLGDGGERGPGEVHVHLIDEGGNRQLVRYGGGEHHVGRKGAGNAQVSGQLKCLQGFKRSTAVCIRTFCKGGVHVHVCIQWSPSIVDTLGTW